MYTHQFIIIAEREARRIIVLPDSGPRGYIYIPGYMSATDVSWAPAGGVKTIKKKTMRLHGRAWPLQLFLVGARDLKRRLHCSLETRPFVYTDSSVSKRTAWSRGYLHCRARDKASLW